MYFNGYCLSRNKQKWHNICGKCKEPVSILFKKLYRKNVMNVKKCIMKKITVLSLINKRQEAANIRRKQNMQYW